MACVERWLWGVGGYLTRPPQALLMLDGSHRAVIK